MNLREARAKNATPFEYTSGRKTCFSVRLQLFTQDHEASGLFSWPWHKNGFYVKKVLCKRVCRQGSLAVEDGKAVFTGNSRDSPFVHFLQVPVAVKSSTPGYDSIWVAC